ncbi:MAG: 3-oxo-tetronate kinase [Luteibacter sp.]
MSLYLGAIADDYTGASDLASTLAGNGLRVVQTIGVPPDGIALPDVDAVVVALKSRSIPAEVAVRQSMAADAWLRAHGAAHVLFKICSTFDSTAKGNIGPVTEALAAAHQAMPIVCPAFPRNRRTVYQGHLFVGADRLDESPLKDHPLNPMRDSSLVRLMRAQSRSAVGLLSLAVIRAGDDVVRTEIARLRQAGCGSVIADAVTDADLEVLGRVALDDTVSTGASGLGLGLARAIVVEREPSAGAGPDSAPDGLEGSLVLAGSCSAATLEQLEVAEREWPMLRLGAEELMSGTTSVKAIVDWARRHLAEGPAVVATSASPDRVASLQARHGAQRVSALLEGTLAEVAAQLADEGLSRLIVAGGETSGAVVDRLGIEAFLIGRELAPGVPMLHALGRRYADLRLVLKSGNFGGPGFFTEAIVAR